MNGVCCPINKDEDSSVGDDLLENSEGRSNSAKTKQEKGTTKATACLLTNSQKQKIQSSRCTRSNVKRESVETSDNFIAKQIQWPFVTFNPQNHALVRQHFVWRYKRAIDLGFDRIIGGKPINPHQFKFVVSCWEIVKVN